MPQKLLIAGYFGFGNTGDEAILAAMLQDIRELQPDLAIVVMSGDPANTKISHQVEAIAWSDQAQIVSAIKLCDFVILGGGGLFHDYWGFDQETILTSKHNGLGFYSSIAMLASIFDKPLMLYAVGIGPLISAMGKFATRAIAERASFISVRDPQSRKELLSLGIADELIHVTSDPVFGWRTSESDIQIKGADIQADPVLGVALRNWDVEVNPEHWEQEIAAALDHFLNLHKQSRVIFIPFQDQAETLLDDYGISARIQSLLVHSNRTNIIRESDSFSEKAALISRCDLILGMRLHALIFAIKSSVPAVGLSYDPKISLVMAQAGIKEYALDLSEITAQNLSNLLDAAYQDRRRLSLHLRKTSSRLARKAHQNAAFLKGILSASITLQPPTRPAMEKYLGQVALSLSLALETSTNQTKELTNTKANLEQLVNLNQIENLKLKSEITNLEIAQKGQLTILGKEAQEKAVRIEILNSELTAIKKSRGWKLLWGLWQTRLLIIPHGSRREKLLNRLWRSKTNSRHRAFSIVGNYAKKVCRFFSFGMSRHAFAFDKYKRHRLQAFSSDLSALQVPGQKDLVSIVMPVFNGADLIREALDSILNQSYRNFELIIIDDGSQDNTREILEEYARRDARLQVIHQENQKLPKALTRGFQLAKGEFLTWTSHDNRLKPDFLINMIACLRRHPAWDMVYANMDIIGDDGKPLRGSAWFGGYQQPPGSEHIHLPAETAELNTWPNNFIGGAFMYQARAGWLIGPYSPWQYTREDYDYWMQINANLTLRHADFKEPVYDYRFHGNSLTHQDKQLRITSDRKYLMVFDDFRRDFFQMPMLYFIDPDSVRDPVNEEVTAFLDAISRAGHVVLDSKPFRNSPLPRSWIPSVYLKISSDPCATTPSPDTYPANTVRVLLHITEQNNQGHLPKLVDSNWDMCLSYGPEKFLPHLEKDRQGWWGSQDIQNLATAVDIFARSRFLSLIGQEIYQQPVAQYKISVIICTHRGGSDLESVLRAIANQSMSPQDYEVIIVDNNPSGSTSEHLIDLKRTTEFSSFLGTLRLILCPILGLSYARNAGISAACGEILFFLDDDAIAKADILDQYWQAFLEHPETGVIGGHIILKIPDQLSIPWKDGWERYWSHFVTPFSGFTAVTNWWEYPWGANWCARRKAMLQIGGFRGRFGRRGNNYGGGEELVAASLVQRLGYCVAVLPQAEVIHHVDPARFTLEHVKQTIKAGIFVHYQAQQELFLPVETNLRNSSLQIMDAMRKISSILLHSTDPASRAGLLEAYFHLSARMQLFGQQMLDLSRRIRRPVTSKK